jgi:type IV secretion system protein VirD4
MKKQLNLKKLILLNLPYVVLGLYATKLGQAYRLAAGADLSGKLLHLVDGFLSAFQSPFPSFYSTDLLIGLACGVGLRLAVYIKGKNAKKYRHNVEYGSARWGSHEDIAPYIDPVFQNNVILTQSERLTMNSRPKDPKTARNKNVVVIGGSGSGKTRFWLKPNLMQMHSSYVVTDPPPPPPPPQGQCSDKIISEDITHLLFYQSTVFFIKKRKKGGNHGKE